MKRITHYRILADNTRDRLEFKVNEHIREGWQPYGPLNPETPDDYPSQVVVKYADDERPA